MTPMSTPANTYSPHPRRHEARKETSRYGNYLKYVKKSHLYLILRMLLLHKILYTCYSDRFTPVLLIVSLAGIKVCSPDGKVSTRDAHTDTPAEKDTSRLCTDVVVKKPSCPAASSKTQLHPLEFHAKKRPHVLPCLPLRENEFKQCVQMAHALRRIFYATCEPQHTQFSFLAREPGAHFSLQYCHSFITESAEQEERAWVLRPANTRGNIVSNVDTLTTTESQDLKASFCCLEDNITRGFEVPMAGTDIPKEVYEHSRYRCLFQEISRKRYRVLRNVFRHDASFESEPKSAIERLVALTAGQRTRIANSCASYGAGSPSSGVLGRGRVKRIRSHGKDHERDRERQAERERLTGRLKEKQRKRKREREREREREKERGTARVRGRTGTRGIQQLPLNVFNAAVEARKRSVGRSHRSASRKSRWGWNRVGRPERCSRFVFLVDFSLSLYVPGDIAEPVKHGIHILRLCELPPRDKQQRRQHQDRLTYNENDKKRTE
ncbi:hypothetical protein ALC60_13666 [Trachymyrmex zeteki]|uniref:Uncharacterized protein n=1 Tax=Mycetomoellerius zeteki TaxID=64791 RepID=A0A151WHM2_9HYME|nr:hypothetical protein ALC60_13666 [Trachymyrmex zeteki]